MLRRKLLDTLRPLGVLHVYMEDASEGFLTSLGVRPSDVIYSDFDTWRRTALRSSLRRPLWFVDKPGELQLAKPMFRIQLRLLPLVLAARASRGRVLRMGIGERGPDATWAPRFRAIFRFSDILAWRDTASVRDVGIGTLMPDWGFGDRGPEPVPVAPELPRDGLVVSYRSDREELPPEAISALRAFAGKHGLSISVVCQVKRDGPSGRVLAERLSAEFVDWPDTTDHRDQEFLLRTIYRRAALVVSDRLHVLIVGMTEGAVPVCLVARPEGKVARHFEAIGYEGTSIDVSNLDAEQIVEVLDAQLARGSESSAALERAVAAIESIAARLAALAVRRGRG